ncbi:MAG: hypothetical protein QXU32_13060 [Nitrososphaerales archaeon]
MPERIMPVCFTKSQIEEIERYAKTKGMMNLSQAVEDIIKNNGEQ